MLKYILTRSRRSPTRAALVATVVSYQLAEIDAEVTADGVDRSVEIDADTN